MKSIIFSLLLSMPTTICLSQQAQKITVAFHSDLIKSDNDGFFEKVQGGLEGSYYFSRKFAATGGVEWWSDEGKIFVLPGMRFYPTEEAFVRIRGLLGKDLSLGAGFAKPLSENFRIEAMGDLYFEGHITIRAGIAYGIGKKNLL